MENTSSSDFSIFSLIYTIIHLILSAYIFYNVFKIITEAIIINRNSKEKEGIFKNILKIIYDKYNTMLVFVYSDPNAKGFDEITKRINHDSRINGIDKNKSLMNYINSIENKSTALLQHISVMLALSIFLFSITQKQDLFMRSILIIEVFGYIWAALCCLRCLLQIRSSDISDYHDEYEDLEELQSTYLIEAFKREYLYRHAMQVLVALTLLLSIVIILELPKFLLK